MARLARVRRTLLVLATLLAGGLLALMLILRSSLFQSLAARRAAEIAAGALGQPVRLGGLGLDLAGRVELRELAIGPEGAEWLAVDRARARADLAELARGIVRARSVDVDGARVHLVFDEQGESNLPAGTGGPPNQGPSGRPGPSLTEILERYSSGRVRLRDCSFEMDFAPADLTVTAGLARAEFVQGTRPRGRYGVEIEIDPAVVKIEDVLDVSGRLSLAGVAGGDGADVEELHFVSVSGLTDLVVSEGRLDDYEAPRLLARLRGRTRFDEVSAMILTELPLAGEVQFEGRAQGPAEMLAASLELRADEMAVLDLPLAEVEARAAWDGRTGRLEHARAVAAGGLVQASGTVRTADPPDGPALEGSAALQGVDLAVLLAVLAGAATGPLPATASATFSGASFDPRSFRAEADFSIRQSAAGGAPELELTGRARAADGGFELVEADLRAAGNRMHGEQLSLTAGGALAGGLQVELTRPELLWRAAARNLPRLADSGIPELTGLIRGRFGLGGTTAQPEVAFELAGSEIEVRTAAGPGPLDLGAVEGRGRLAAGRLTLDRLALAGPAARAGGSAELLLGQTFAGPAGSPWNGLPLGRLALDLEAVDLAALGRLLAPEAKLAGSLAGEAVLELAAGGRASGRLQVNGRGLATAGQPIEALDASAAVLPGGLDLTSITATTAAGELSAAGDWRGGVRGRLTAAGELPLADLAFLKGAGLAGRLSLRGELAGQIGGPQAEVELRLVGLGPAGGPAALGDLDLRARLHGGRLQFEGGLPAGGAAVEGTVQLDPPGDFRLGVEFEAAPLESWLALAGVDLAGLAGRLGGRLEASGPIARPEEIAVKLDLHSFRASLGGVELASRNDLHLAWSAAGASFAEWELAGSAGSLRLAGRIGAGGELAGSVHGDLGLELLPGLVPEVNRARGRARLELNLGGELAAPAVTGRITLEEVALRDALTMQWLEDFHAGIALENRLFRIEYGLGRFGDSDVFVSGQFGISAAGAFLDLAATGQAVTLRYPEGLRSELDLDLTLAGPLDKLLLQGDVFVRDALYTRRLDYRSIIYEESRAVLRLRQRETQPLRPPEPGGGIRLALAIQAPDTVRVVNNLAQLEMRAALDLIGTSAAPHLAGRLEVTSGTFTYQNRRFNIDHATLDFIDPDLINPYLDLAASARIQDYEVMLAVTGPVLGELTVTPSSDPPLGDVDLWSLIALGVRADEFPGASGLAATEAASLVTGQLQDELEKRLKLIGGFDEFSIDPIFSDVTDSAAARFTAKKRLGERLTVTYSTTAASSGEQLVILEYALSDGLKLVGERTEDGSLGLDFRFHWEFD